LGQKLVEYYKKAEKIGGKKAQLRLGLLTCIPLIFAKVLEDSSETIKTFDKALKEIEKEHINEEKR
jgi:hypothetical protein